MAWPSFRLEVARHLDLAVDRLAVAALSPTRIEKPGRFRDLCWDDLEWSDVLQRCLVADFDYHADALANALDPAVILTFHGCRTDDAGSYFRGGLRVHDRAAMTAQVRAIVDGSEELCG